MILEVFIMLFFLIIFAELFYWYFPLLQVGFNVGVNHY